MPEATTLTGNVWPRKVYLALAEKLVYVVGVHGRLRCAW
jgi:hypothetical protein